MTVRPAAGGPLLCPVCRKLISAAEPRCPHCGLRSPGARWRHIGALTFFRSADRLIHAIIAASGCMYLLSLVLSDRGVGISANPLALLAPDVQGLVRLGATGTIPIDQLGRWWTLVSASYLHGGLLHILFNMMALRQIAPLITNEYGTHRMLSIFTISGVVGFMVSYLAGVSLTIGASAAVCGLIGAALVYGKSHGGAYGRAVYRQVGGWAMGILLFGLVVPGINNWAHGGGLGAGILLGWIMGYEDRIQTTNGHRIIGWVCLITTVVVLGGAILGNLIPG